MTTERAHFMVCSGYLPLFGVMAICRGQYDARFKCKYILKEHVIYEGTVRLDIYESAEDVETNVGRDQFGRR